MSAARCCLLQATTDRYLFRGLPGKVSGTIRYHMVPSTLANSYIVRVARAARDSYLVPGTKGCGKVHGTYGRYVRYLGRL